MKSRLAKQYKTSSHPIVSLKAAAEFGLEFLEGRRLLSAGQLDGTFGAAGIVSDPTLPTAAAVAVQPDGKVIIAGPTAGAFQVARYNANGTPDNTFGFFGRLTTNISPSHDIPSSVAVQTDGKIVVLGSNGFSFEVVRYLANGQLDNTFGTGGIKTLSIGSVDTSTRVLIQSDGKIVAAGSAAQAPSSPIGTSGSYIMRFNANGTPDATFGIGGQVQVSTGLNTQVIPDIALQADLKIVVALDQYSAGGSSAQIRRFNANGTPDGGAFTLGGGAGNTLINRLAIQADQKIVAVGRYNSDAIVLRENTNGTPDGTFGVGGLVKDVTGVANTTQNYSDMFIQPDGKIVAVGDRVYLNPATGFQTDQFVLTRYVGSGALDAGFGTSGKAITPIGTFFIPSAKMAASPDGGIIVAGATGSITDPIGSYLGIAKYQGGPGSVVPVSGGTINGAVYNDLNSNGTRELGENGIANQQVYLDLNGLGFFVAGDPTTTSDANGNYSFPNLPPASYIVRLLNVPASQTQTNPLPVFGGHYYVPNLLSGQVVSGADFGLHASVGGLISGRLLLQTGPSQSALAGRTVYLDLAGDGSQSVGDPTTTSDATGFYSFSGLAIQNYIVKSDFAPAVFNLLTPPLIFGGKYFIPAGTIGAGPVTGNDFIVQLVV